MYLFISLHTKKRLFGFDYRLFTSINDHITAFNQLVANLINLDETFKDEDLGLMLLSSLPDEFNTLILLYFMGRIRYLLMKFMLLCIVMN